MAVVLISPKQRQKMFFLGITIMFLLLLVIISLVVFLAQPKEVSPVLIFNKPKVSIDMTIFDSDQFGKLVSFTEAVAKFMEPQFSYTAFNANNKTKTGFIYATTEDDAKTALENSGWHVSTINPVKVGRDNPFVPYYTVVTTPAGPNATAK